MTDSWTLLRINPANQSKFVDLASEQFPHISFYYPQYDRITRPHKKRYPIKVRSPIYPGYIFCRLNLATDSVRRISSLPVRVSFIRLKRISPLAPPSISTIPDSIIQEFRRMESSHLLMHQVERINPIRPGARVLIHLPVTTLEGVILHLMGQTRALCDVSICNIVVPVAKLQPLAPP